MSTVMIKTLGEVRDVVTRRVDECVLNRSSASHVAVVDLLDSMLDYYAVLMASTPKVNLPEIQTCLQQVRAIREALTEEDKRPTIF